MTASTIEVPQANSKTEKQNLMKSNLSYLDSITLAAALVAATPLFGADAPKSSPEEKLHPAIAEGLFQPTWDSLKQYQCPDWFRDAKFGIWAHWGPQCVPEEGDWYARNMYVEDSSQYKYHVEHYGHPSEFGYKDIIPLWKAEKFDPDRLMERYKKAGARYFVSMGVHHDNFDLWNSRYHKWNAVNMGPKKDIVGLWAAAAHKYGLRFGVSEHLERSYSWFNVNKGADKQGPKAGVPYDGNNSKYADFYFPPHEDTRKVYPANPPEWWKKQWYDRIQDLVDSYHPDLLYTDGGVPFGEVGRSLVAHFYNQNMKWHNGRLEAVYNIKNMKEHGDYFEGIAVEDLERGTLKGIKAEPWQTDTSAGDWFYKRGYPYKTSAEIIHLLADIVSKNGTLLINFPQRPDGTLDAQEETILDDLAAWMPINGEAIFETRPWHVFGEGPNMLEGGHKREEGKPFTAEDIRFTTKGETLYAIALGWPADGKLLVKSLAAGSGLYPRQIGKVELLGAREALKWNRNAEGLTVELPLQKPCEHAYALKITPQTQ
jgi:alpha-L-fucosidase